MAIFANTSGPTTVRNGFLVNAPGVHRISLAAPFFSYPEIITDIGTADRVFSVLVRLCAATPPDALRKAMSLPNVNVRFFTSRKFHSKLYIFGDRCALVGSANLTQSGLQGNREIVLQVPRENPDFDDLVLLFQAYWNEALVLNEARLSRYTELWSRRTPTKSPDAEFEDSVFSVFGDISPSGGIQVGPATLSGEQLYLEDYRRGYVKFLSAFRDVETVYKADGRRQQRKVPLRIEIDQFLSFVREKHCPGEAYLDAPVRPRDEDRWGFVREIIDEWFKERWAWLDDHAVAAFSRINARLGSPDAIAAATMEEIIDGLEVCHAFHELLRFHLGGIAALRKDFSNANDIQRVRNTLTYLLHGKDDFVDRMGRVIFDPALKLAMIGRSVAQELLGWVNGQDVPICNGRAVKSLRFLGYDVSE